MTDMQRYLVAWDIPMKSFVRLADPDGPYVLASDAEAAIAAAAEHAVAEHIALADKVWVEILAKAEAAAEQRGREIGMAAREDVDTAYAMGQRDMLHRCIAAVEVLPHDACAECCEVDVVAALRGLGVKGSGNSAETPHLDPCDCDECVKAAQPCPACRGTGTAGRADDPQGCDPCRGTGER